jgi:hypothetical protein
MTRKQNEMSCRASRQGKSRKEETHPDGRAYLMWLRVV